MRFARGPDANTPKASASQLGIGSPVCFRASCFSLAARFLQIDCTVACVSSTKP
jgi:hypothetical protein